MLKYLMIYQDSGLPIFSKCYSDFCGLAMKEPAILTGFLNALENFSKELIRSEECTIDSLRMGNSVMRFSKSFPSGHSVVIGLDKDNQKTATDIFKAIENLLEIKYRNKNWKIKSADFDSEFEKALLNDILVPTLHNHGGFADDCPFGNECPLFTSHSQKKRIWVLLKERYQIIKKKKTGM